MADNDSPLPAASIDTLSTEVQLDIYKHLEGVHLNVLRQVDRYRRYLVDGNARLFGKKRLIPRIEIVQQATCDGDDFQLRYEELCLNCQRRNIQVRIDFEDGKCFKFTRWCLGCDTGKKCESFIGSTLEECLSLITRGARIEQFSLNCYLSGDLIQSHGLRHLLDSSDCTVFDYRGSQSPNAFMSIILASRMLYWKVALNCPTPSLDDDFFLNAGKDVMDILWSRPFPVTDAQLAMLMGRSDLTFISLRKVEGITLGGLRQAVQILLAASSKNVLLSFREQHPFGAKFDISELSMPMDSESIVVERKDSSLFTQSVEESITYTNGYRTTTMEIVVLHDHSGVVVDVQIVSE